MRLKGQTISEGIFYSVIIPAYNEADYIERTLDFVTIAMGDLNSHKGEILVVDNNSTDNTSALAKAKGARVVFEKENQISLARNKGTRLAKGELLFFIDADTIISSKLLSLAISRILMKNVGGGGSVLVFDSHQNKYFFGKVIPRIWMWISQNLKLAAGSFIFCKKNYFLRVGGFSEKVFAGEEILFSQRYKKICRANGERFEILDEFPVITSSRKLNWFSPSQILISILIPLFFPPALRWKSLCSFWYKRPKQKVN